jgi:leader peptidase (prepilin peptidase)/N-methyltransferase
MAVALFSTFGLSHKFVSFGILSACLIVATFSDLETQEIPDEVSLGGLMAGLAFACVFPDTMGSPSWHVGLLNSALGALAGAGSIYLMGFFGEMVFRKEAMGGGDVKLMAMAGAFLGWKLALFAFFLAPVFGSIVGIILKAKDGRDVIPYGPYLSLAAVVAVFWGEAALKLLFYGLYQ